VHHGRSYVLNTGLALYIELSLGPLAEVGANGLSHICEVRDPHLCFQSCEFGRVKVQWPKNPTQIRTGCVQ
jgi:hypothetical protein